MDNTQLPVQTLEIANRGVDRSIASDCTAPTLLDLLNATQQNLPGVSGLTDQDYPVLPQLPLPLNMTQIKMISKVPLPPEILEHFGHIQCHCMMGLFPEINRAWLTVDSDIYVWTYEENGDLAYFDGLNETILSVGLVKPKPGVFHAFIKHLLVLTTAVDLIILGVTFTEGPNGPLEEIQLIPDPIFTIPTDGSTFSAICCSAEGRLFLGSKEGCLFEIAYQAESGWFGKRFKKINHSSSSLSFLVPSFLNAALNEEDGIIQIVIDNSRHILYTLTEKGSIEVYDLGENGNSFTKVTKISQASLVKKALDCVKTLDSQNFKPIVSISPVELKESNTIHLVAVTQTGVRFYLSTLFNLQSVPAPNQRPYTLQLAHVRLPPGYSANISIRPRAVHLSYYNQRNLLLLSTVNEKDVLWCISSDLFPFSNHLIEAYTNINLDAPALALAEVQQPNPLEELHQDGAPLIVRQHSDPQKKYVILTSQGVYIFKKLYPVDVLRELLRESKGPESESVKAFFMIQKEDQACATSLIISCLDADKDMEMAEHATRAFFLFGGEPKVATQFQHNNQSLLSGTTMFSPNVMSSPIQHQSSFQQTTPGQIGSQSFMEMSQRYPYQTNFDLNSNPPTIFSSKHNGLYLYLGRILLPIWNRRCIEKITINDKVVNISTITAEQCRSILNYLTTLHKFLLLNTQLSLGEVSGQHTTIGNRLNNSTTLNQTRMIQNYTVQDAQMDEKMSLNAFKSYVFHCCQVVGLWRILCEHQFHVLIGTLPEQQQQTLQNTQFKNLFLYGHDICTVLISVLVDSYLSDNASVDSISNKLREVCPNLYKIEDAAFSKANEMLKSSRGVQNNDEKEEMLLSALELCKSIAPNINLPAVCKQFVSLKAYNAVLDLCITCAKKSDPENIAAHYYKTESAPGDHEGQSFFHKRISIYGEIFNMLDVLYNENPSIDLTQGLSIMQSDNIGESQSVVTQIINEILVYPDEILHVTLYDWMMRKKLISDLIKVNNPSLETYLVHTSQQNPDKIEFVDLLWKYYENNGNHAAAAKILDNLASKTGPMLTLHNRLEYLTRAIMCMRSDKIGYAPYLGVFLSDLEDKLEVARVQEQILDAVTQLRGTHPNADEAIQALNSNLFQISQLYEDFAEPFELWECQLAIINCAGYTDDNLIEKIWRSILRREIRKSTGTANTRLSQILAKVKQIARQCGPASHCFPLGFIVAELEQLASYLKADRHLIPQALVSMEVPFETMLEEYNKILGSFSEILIWQKEENEFHLFYSITALINTFLKEYTECNSVQKRKIISLCQDTVASILSFLYSKANTEELVTELRGIQNRLARL